jgi:hypothetical protein
VYRRQNGDCLHANAPVRFLHPCKTPLKLASDQGEMISVGMPYCWQTGGLRVCVE